MASKDIVLEDRDLKKVLVLGTGLTESILSASMAFSGYPSLNLDLDVTYASSIKTVSLKELIALYKDKQEVNEAKNQSGFEPLFLETEVSEEYIKKNSRNYSLDFQPRVLYSRSISVEKMVEAGMDKYMDFRAVTGIFWLDAKTQKWQTLPISKNAIYKDGSFDLREKRELFKLLHTCVGLYSQTHDTTEDINSTMEFDKQSDVTPKDISNYKEYENKNCYEFLSNYTKSERLKNAFIYIIGNIQVDCKEAKEADESISTKKLLRNVYKFIKSAGVHSTFPYLYTNYGTGDIPQGFARVSGVMGSIYIIQPQIRVGKLEFEEESKEEDKESKIKLETSLAGERKSLEFEYVVMNRDYEHLIPGFENKDTESRRLLRVMTVIEDASDTLESTLGPELYYIYPKTEPLENVHPIQVMVCNEYTYSVPENHFVIYASTVVEAGLGKDELEALSKRIKELVVNRCLRKKPVEAVKKDQKSEEGTEEKEEPKAPEVIVFTGFLQKIRGKNQVGAHKNVFLVDDDDFGIDFDEFFERSQTGFRELFGAERVMALSVKTSDQHFEQSGRQQEEEEGDHPIMKHLEDLDKFRVQESSKLPQAETEAKVEKTNESEGQSQQEGQEKQPEADKPAETEGSEHKSEGEQVNTEVSEAVV